MKITNVGTRLIQIPFTELLQAAYGARDRCTLLLVSVETDEGITGYGESVGLFFETAATFLQSELKPMLVGEDPLRIEYLAHKMDNFIEWDAFTAHPIAAIDVALYDIKGKSLGIPVYELLGGRYRGSASFSGLIHIHTPKEDASTARKLIESGYRTLKVKVGHDPKLDFDRLSAIREAVGEDVRIRIDPNMAWSPRTSVRLIERYERFNLEYVEQPVPGWDIDGLRDVTTSVAVPICADESCRTVRDALALVEKRACEVFLVYLSEAGGLSRARDIVAIANAGGVACVLGTWGEGAALFSAGLHLIASSRTFDIDNDTAYGVQADDYIDEPFDLNRTGGKVDVPSGPGLGIEPNWDKVERYEGQIKEDSVFRAAPEGIPRYRRLLV